MHGDKNIETNELSCTMLCCIEITFCGVLQFLLYVTLKVFPAPLRLHESSFSVQVYLFLNVLLHVNSSL